jgi:Rieske Fe-S protein
MLSHDLQINAQYKRFLQSDIQDIEDLPAGEGGVLNPLTKLPEAVYKDYEGKVHKFSALCPHLKGVVCRNSMEKSWNCPVHGSRFSKEGVLLNEPAKRGLRGVDGEGGKAKREVFGLEGEDWRDGVREKVVVRCTQVMSKESGRLEDGQGI